MFVEVRLDWIGLEQPKAASRLLFSPTFDFRPFPTTFIVKDKRTRQGYILAFFLRLFGNLIDERFLSVSKNRATDHVVLKNITTTAE
jgi:hypothetical protein